MPPPPQRLYITAPNEGLDDLLWYMIGIPLTGVLPWQVALFTNPDLVIDQETVWADLAEAAFRGYFRVSLTRDFWTYPIINELNEAESTYTTTPLSWTCSGGPETITGYAILSGDPDPVIRFLSGIEPVDLAPGATLGILPRVTLTTFPADDPPPTARGVRHARKSKGR